MQEHIRTVYVLWGALALLLTAQLLWGLFFAYPVGLERMLRRGRSWVYVPLRWQGFRRLQILFVSRLLVIAVTATGTYLVKWLVIFPHGRAHLPHPSVWLGATVVVLYTLASWLQATWNGLRYRQQEDAYFLLHDELRAKLVAENKDYTEAQVRSLSAYQHQQRLRKADEEGKLLALIHSEARLFRQARPASSVVPPAPEA